LQSQHQPDDSWAFPLVDGLGSVRGVVNEDLSHLESRQYSPYGEVYGTTGSEQTAFGFTGEPVDANGLVHLRARYYDPMMGRFFQMDPSRQERNLYEYAGSNPVMFMDPSGECSWCLALLVALIVGLSQTGSTPTPDVYQTAIVEYVEDPTVRQWIANDPTAELLVSELMCTASESASVETLTSLGATGTLETLGYAAPAAVLFLQPMTTPNVIQGPIEYSYDYDVIQQAIQAASSDFGENDQSPRDDDCTREKVEALTIGRSVADVVYSSVLGDRINNKPTNATQISVQRIGPGSVSDYAYRALCEGSPFPPVPIIEGVSYNALADGHHRFVASRLVNIPVEGTTQLPPGFPPLHPEWDFNSRGNYIAAWNWYGVEWSN
jgi:RHS repeat-associated protein